MAEENRLVVTLEERGLVGILAWNAAIHSLPCDCIWHGHHGMGSESKRMG